MTEESLSKEIRTYFQWLVVFREDTIIRPDTLATIWDMNKYDAVDIVEGILITVWIRCMCVYKLLLCVL